MGEHEVLRFRQRWSGGFAVGPASAITDRAPARKYFETVVDVTPEAREHFVSRRHAALGAGQRPLLHIGFTARAPHCNAEDPLPDDFCADMCWLIAMTGHVYCGGDLQCTVPVIWPDGGLSRQQSAACPVKPHRQLHIGLFLAETGALHLTVNGHQVATSPEDVVPRSMLWGASPIFPLVVLGPNVDRVTLVSPSRAQGST